MLNKLPLFIWWKYYSLTILKELEKKENTRFVQCKCSCWKIIEIKMNDILYKFKKSCWCLIWKNIKTHWMSWLRIHKIFKWIINRCENNKNIWYKNYGWRWIKCEWSNFEEFYRDMWYSYQEWLTIERIDNNWNYCSYNCCWATHKEQANNKRNNLNITVNGKTQNLTQWCRELNLKYNTIHTRINKYGWSYKKALELI